MYVTSVAKRAILLEIVDGVRELVSIAVRKATSKLVVLFSVRYGIVDP